MITAICHHSWEARRGGGGGAGVIACFVLCVNHRERRPERRCTGAGACPPKKCVRKKIPDLSRSCAPVLPHFSRKKVLTTWHVCNARSTLWYDA